MKAQHHIASGWSFVITPTLDRGWGYDPYVQNLIGRIRAGRPALPCLFDNNSLFLRSGQDAELERPAAKKREISDADMAEYRAEAAKRKAAWDIIYAEQRRKALEEKAERERVEKEWKKKRAAAERKDMEQALERLREWDAARPRQQAVPVTIPLPGWWRKQGDDVVVAVLLQAVHDMEVLVGPEGAGMWLAKFQIKQVKNFLNGLHELTLDGALAKQLGFCQGEPRSWSS